MVKHNLQVATYETYLQYKILICNMTSLAVVANSICGSSVRYLYPYVYMQCRVLKTADMNGEKQKIL